VERLLGTRLVLGAAVLCLIVVPIAAAGAASDAGGPQAQASASVKKQVKKLSRKVKRLKRQVTGPAGGDLAGTYPDPAIATGAVNSANVADGSLGGADIDPLTSIHLLGGPVGANFATLSAADGLVTRAGALHTGATTKVSGGGITLSEFDCCSPGSGARLSSTDLTIEGEDQDPHPAFPGDSSYGSTITLPGAAVPN
jgi:hypothetical protein